MSGKNNVSIFFRIVVLAGIIFLFPALVASSQKYSERASEQQKYSERASEQQKYSERASAQQKHTLEQAKGATQKVASSRSILDGVFYKENKPKKVIVVIDPGHGGKDHGAAREGLSEKTVNLDICKRLGGLLGKDNINIIYTRDRDEYVDLLSRADMANKAGATLFLSVHNNIMPETTAYRGTETLFFNDCIANDKMTGKRFAEITQRELTKSLKTRDNGIIERPNLAVLKFTAMPAIIAEVGYLSNKSDRAKLSSPEFRQATAEALKRAVMSTLKEMNIKKKDDVWVLP